MKKSLLLGMVLLAASSPGAFGVEDWWWDYQAANNQVPSDQLNKVGNVVCAVSSTSPDAQVTWNDLGGSPTNYSMRLQQQTRNTKYYWRYESGALDWVAPMDGFGNYTVDFRAKINSISVAPLVDQNNAMAWFLGFQRMKPDEGSVAASVKSRLYVSDRPKIGNGSNSSDWGPVTPGVAYIYDDDLNDDPVDYMDAHWAVNLGEWFTLRYSILTLPGDSVSKVWVWLNGELASTWEDKPINIATNQHDYYLGFNDRKKCLGDMEWDYIRVAGECYDIDGNSLRPVLGDANLDGYVDDKDASILGANWLREGPDFLGMMPSWATGDFNGDDKVNDADAAILAAHWGEGVGEESVPEPTTVRLLLGLLMVAAAAVWRRT